MIRVYLDESRQEDRDGYMSLAGFWGTEKQWSALAVDWGAALGKRKTLHMKALRWNSKTHRCKQLLAKLGPLPNKHGLTPVYGAVKTGDYLDIVAGSPHKEKWPGYVVCLTAVMQRLNRTVPSHESIKIVCESQEKYEAIGLKMFRQVRVAMSRPDRPFFSSIEFIHKDLCMLIQPSDFLAFAIAHYYEAPNSKKSLLCKSMFGQAQEKSGLKLQREDIRRIVSKRVTGGH